MSDEFNHRPPCQPDMFHDDMTDAELEAWRRRHHPSRAMFLAPVIGLVLFVALVWAVALGSEAPPLETAFLGEFHD